MAPSPSRASSRYEPSRSPMSSSMPRDCRILPVPRSITFMSANPGTSPGIGHSGSRRRVAVAYVLLLVVVAAVALVVFQVGARQRPTPQLAADYRLEASSPCLGGRGGHLQVRQSGQFVSLEGADRAGGRLRLRDGRLQGEVSCRDGSVARLELRTADMAKLTGSVGVAQLTIVRVAPPPVGAGTAGSGRPPSAEEAFGQLMLAIAAVILAARLVGAAVRKLGQPRVMGEVLAGILLGPTLVGAIAPGVSALLFPDWVVPLLRATADVGLAFYMFLVGLELDPRLLRGRVEQAARISHASIALPMALGISVALPLYKLMGPSGLFAPFALFMGVAMAITAFPVLARILLERRHLRRRAAVVVRDPADRHRGHLRRLCDGPHHAEARRPHPRRHAQGRGFRCDRVAAPVLRGHRSPGR